MPTAYRYDLRSHTRPNTADIPVYRVEVLWQGEWEARTDLMYQPMAENVARQEANRDKGTTYRVVELQPGKATGRVVWSGVYQECAYCYGNATTREHAPSCPQR